MQNRISHKVAGCLAAAAMLFGTVAHANLVNNGGFESGDFTDWTEFGNGAFSGVDSFAPHSGTFAAFFGPVGATGGISQSLATVAGNFYDVRFWLQNEADVTGAAAPNSFEFNWDGGAAELTLTNSAAFGYTEYSFSLMATAALTELKFTFGHDPAFWDLDDVSAVPEPGSLALVGLAGGLAAMLGRRRRDVILNS